MLGRTTIMLPSVVLLCVLATSASHDGYAEWKKIQQNTFTRWCNKHLNPVRRHIRNIETDFSDGLNLIALLQQLSGKKIPRYNRKPVFRSQKLENVNIALKFVENQKIKLVNIDASDITKGDLKLILGLTWTLILKYHIRPPLEDYDNAGSVTPKQALMGWVKSKMPEEVRVENFNKDWNNGLVISSLVESVAPGLFPEWQDLDANNGVDNARKAMTLAEKWLGIPMVITPQELANPNVDELSVMTYVAYFPDAKLKPGAPLKPAIKMEVPENSDEFNLALQDAVDQGATHANVQGFKVASVGLPATMMVVGVVLLAFVTRSSFLRRGLDDAAREHIDLEPAE